MGRYQIDFTEPPPVGTVIAYRGQRAVLVEVPPIHRRSDGEPGWLLTWMIDGRRATSGLRSESVTWERASRDARPR